MDKDNQQSKLPETHQSKEETKIAEGHQENNEPKLAQVHEQKQETKLPQTNQDKQKIKIAEMHKSALQSRSRAYCPYSKFAVGSVILGANGKYYTGCNVQKAVNSLCAERTAIAKMVEDGCRHIKQVYVLTQLTGHQIAAPCGYCRQYIKQFSHEEDETLMVHLGSVSKGHQISVTFAYLFPMSFGPYSLGMPLP